MDISAPDSATPRELLPAYYKAYGFESDGGYKSKVVAIKFGKLFKLYLPNFDARRKAIRKHDLHHMITGYSPGSLLGESEIGVWEIVAGTKAYWAALLLDASAIMLGFFMSPAGIFHAFVRGRRTRTLYYELVSDEQAVDMTLGELRALLGIDIFGMKSEWRMSDLLLFFPFMLASFLYSLLGLLAMPIIVVFSLIYSLGVKKTDR